MKKEICDLLSISEVSYYRWKKERKIFSLLEKYFSETDLREFIETNQISKLDHTKTISNVAMHKYHKFIKPILDESYTQLHSIQFHGIDNKQDPIKNVFSYIPIFLLFHYIDNPYRANDITNENFYERAYYLEDSEYSLDSYGATIIKILNKYIPYKKSYQYIHKIFNIDVEIINLLELFHKNRGFSIYYNANILYDENFEEKNFHAYCNFLYNTIRNLQLDLSLSYDEKNKRLDAILKSNKFDSNHNYFKNITSLDFKNFTKPTIILEQEEHINNLLKNLDGK